MVEMMEMVEVEDVPTYFPSSNFLFLFIFFFIFLSILEE